MSSDTTPISPARFAAALSDLTLPSLHAKGAELRNAIAHLQYSNEQLKEFADDGDQDCKQAIQENNETIGRMEERIGLLKVEVENRGYMWDAPEAKEDVEVTVPHVQPIVNGDGRPDGDAATRSSGNGEGPSRRPGLSDEELQRRLMERLAEGDDADGGMHL
ncbi:hypothetical protein MMC25_006123 [Agyrium rufum]|nr:hypothetical protein [Agyrium rufum]